MIPNRARAVIIGAGIAGASIAYHLAELGWRDVAVLEQGDLVSGTTSHAPGLVGQLRSSASLTKMLMHSVALYRQLRVDGVPGYLEVGSLRLASSRERLDELKRQAGFARTIDLEAELLTSRQAAELFPLMNPDGVEGALYLPHDGSAVAPILARALIDEAQAQGVTFHPHTRVRGIDVRAGRVYGVVTDTGRIESEIVVAATGIWSPLIARMAGITLPLTPVQHQYAATAPLDELTNSTVPNLRDPDKLVYLRQDGASLVIGGYERNPRPFRADEIPDAANPTMRRFDAAHFEPLRRAAVERVPCVGTAELARRVNGLESFTPDGEFLLGPVAGVRGFWVACGFCAHGVSGAGGVGKVMAEWIVAGEPSLDLWHMDVRRIGAYAGGARYVEQRVREVYGAYYDVAYPGDERGSMRGLRRSPMYEQLAALGAVFGEKAGWERPNWFACNEGRATVEHTPRGWAARNWSSAIVAEHAAARERVALFDETSFSKLEISGPGALGTLQWLTANEMDRPPGSVTYTQLLNQRGGIECDLTVTRLAADRFMLVTGTAFGTHDLSWIRQHLPDDGSVRADDVTSSRCCVGLWGPRARDVLQAVSDDDVSNAAFPYLTARHITVGAVPVLALRVTYVGELGWELYAPMEYGHALWQTLWDAARAYDAAPAGYRAIDSLRLEKGYRYWSADIQGEYTPFEAGLGFAVKLDKGDFLGRAALLKAREQGVRRKLACLTLDDPTAVVLGGEAIMDGERAIGRVTSGGYGYTVLRSIAYGYLPVEYAAPGTQLDVLWFGQRIAAVVAREPLYDPTNSRIKA